MTNLLNYINSYLKITIEGYFVERFINLCSNNRIKIWDVKKINEGLIQAKILSRDFKKIRKFAKTTKCKVKIQKKVGSLFFIRKYKKRKAFIISLLAIFLILIINSMFIWNINISCEEDINSEEILNELNALGIEIGSLKSSIDENKIQNKIRTKRDDIAWIGFEIKGTNLNVKVVKSNKKPEIIDENEFCNIVSDVEGIITKITVQNGTPQVKENDVITKGDILVLGIIEGKNVEDKFVHASAQVEAKVWRTVKKKIDLKTTENIETGKKDKKISIYVKNFKINFNKRGTNFKSYDKITTKSNVKIFSNLYIPISIEKNEYIELEKKEKILTKEEAKKEAIKEAENELNLQISDESILVNKYLNYKEFEDYIEVELTYENLENIGVKQKI